MTNVYTYLSRIKTNWVVEQPAGPGGNLLLRVNLYDETTGLRQTSFAEPDADVNVEIGLAKCALVVRIIEAEQQKGKQ